MSSDVLATIFFFQGRHYWAQLTSYVKKGGRRCWKRVCVCVCRGGQKIEPRLMLLRHKLQLAHTMWRWEIIEASPILNLRQLFTLAFTNTHPWALRRASASFSNLPFQMQRDNGSWWCEGQSCPDSPLILFLLETFFLFFFLLWECIVLLQIITIKKPLIPHSVKLIELRKKCNDSN